MLGAGGLIFRVHWRDPLAVMVLTASYGLFASGLMTVLPALLGNHRATQALGNVAAMLLGLAGGCTVPAEWLPGNMVMYVMMNLLIFGGTSMAKLREGGLIRRLACQPLSRGQVLAGKTYGLVVLAAMGSRRSLRFRKVNGFGAGKTVGPRRGPRHW